ncbi:MAG: VWA domain-containing protein [Acidobacteriota bacterium]
MYWKPNGLRVFVVAALALPQLAPVAQPFAKGESFHVIAVRVDTGTTLFRTCAPGGRLAPPRVHPGLHLVRTAEPVTLRVDQDVGNRIEAEFTRRKRYRLARTPAEADYVFFAQAEYMAVVEGRAGADVPPERRAERSQSSQPRELFLRGGLDGLPNRLTSVIGLVVPAARMREVPSLDTIMETRLWAGGSRAAAGAPEDVVTQLHERQSGNPGKFVPSGDSQRDAARLQEMEERERVVRVRIRDGICTAPQPAQAVPMSAEPDSLILEVDRRGGLPSSSDTSPDARAAVAVPVSVHGAGGTVIEGLAASDFSVFENDAPQRVASMRRPSDPLTVALVLDTSRSMWPYLTDLKVAASTFLEALGPQDRALVVTFDDRTWLVRDVTGDKDVLRTAVVGLKPFGGFLSRLYDAVDVVLAERLQKIAGRKAMALLTDGMDVDSVHVTASSVMDRVAADGIPLYAMQFDSTSVAPRRESFMERLVAVPEGYFDTTASFERATTHLAALAGSSGGRAERVSTAEKLKRVVDDLRGHHVLYYVPASALGPGESRQVRVEVSVPGAVVRARAGYRATGSGH